MAPLSEPQHSSPTSRGPGEIRWDLGVGGHLKLTGGFPVRPQVKSSTLSEPHFKPFACINSLNPPDYL